jgi:hypothetical protein
MGSALALVETNLMAKDGFIAPMGICKLHRHVGEMTLMRIEDSHVQEITLMRIEDSYVEDKIYRKPNSQRFQSRMSVSNQSYSRYMYFSEKDCQKS